MKRLAIAALAAASACAAKAQTFPAPVVPLVGCSSTWSCAGPVSSTNPMPVSGGFQPASVGTPIAVTSSAVTGALPSGPVVVASNVGANTAYCALGALSSTAQQPIAAGGWFAFSVNSATQLTCLTSTGTTTVNMVGGTGFPTGAGGGGGGSGSIATGSAGAPNASVLTVQGIGGGSAIPVSGAFWQSTQPVSISSLPALSAGSNTIGAISNSGFAATQSGTWNVGLSAGSNIVGKADILGNAGVMLDSAAGTANGQALTIQGNSNGIAVPTSLASLPSLAAGSNTIGSINNISGIVSLPAGAAVSANQPTNAAQASATSGQTGNLNMGAVTASSPWYTSGQTDPLSLTTAGALRVDASATTQPISGSVSIAGTPSVSISGSAVLGAGSATIGNVNQTAATAEFSKITDGTNTAAVKAASTAPAATDPAEVVTESPNSPLAPFAATSTSSVTRVSNTTTYSPLTGWNNATASASGYFTFSSACRIYGGQVLIPQIDIWSSANPTTKLGGTLYLFDAPIGTLVNDDASFAIAPSDFANLTGNQQGFAFALSNSQASGASNSGFSMTGVNYRGQCAPGTTSIYGMVEVYNAYAPASGEVLHVTLHTVGAN